MQVTDTFIKGLTQRLVSWENLTGFVSAIDRCLDSLYLSAASPEFKYSIALVDHFKDFASSVDYLSEYFSKNISSDSDQDAPIREVFSHFLRDVRLALLKSDRYNVELSFSCSSSFLSKLVHTLTNYVMNPFVIDVSYRYSSSYSIYVYVKGYTLLIDFKGAVKHYLKTSYVYTKVLS